MIKQQLYSIGEVSKICNISKKALRYYDKIGIISPDVVSEENNYRFYSKDTLLFVPVIKYFKQMGFKLDEMKEFLQGNSYEVHERGFYNKIEELKEQEEQIHMSYMSVKNWYKLILEADSVIKNNASEVSIKFVDTINTCYLEQEFNQNYKASIINIEWTNYLEEHNQTIIGAVNMWFKNYREKNEGKPSTCRIFQTCITDYSNLPNMTLGNDMMASCYHIGPHETLNETYDKILKWAEEHGYTCDDESIERYVSDYWTIQNPEEFVTEIMIRVSRK